jgi:GGDEF domain-containing protein
MRQKISIEKSTKSQSLIASIDWHLKSTFEKSIVIKKVGTIYRNGVGDEFVIVYENQNPHHLDAALQEIAARIMDKPPDFCFKVTDTSKKTREHKMRLSFSLGTAVLEELDKDLYETIMRAEKKMYVMKKGKVNTLPDLRLIGGYNNRGAQPRVSA